VAELVEEEDLDGRVMFSDDDEFEVGALALICWNCHKESHRHQDCREEKRIFLDFEQQKPTQRANIVNCLCGCAQKF